MIDDCNNHAKVIIMAFSSLLRTFPPLPRLWVFTGRSSNQTSWSAAIIMCKEFADGPRPYTDRDITRRMQGIVGASGKFILLLSSMVLFFIIIKNIHAHVRTIAIRI